MHGAGSGKRRAEYVVGEMSISVPAEPPTESENGADNKHLFHLAGKKSHSE